MRRRLILRELSTCKIAFAIFLSTPAEGMLAPVPASRRPADNRAASFYLPRQGQVPAAVGFRQICRMNPRERQRSRTVRPGYPLWAGKGQNARFKSENCIPHEVTRRSASYIRNIFFIILSSPAWLIRQPVHVIISLGSIRRDSIMNESDNDSLEQTALEPEKLRHQKQPDSSNRQIANLDISGAL